MDNKYYECKNCQFACHCCASKYLPEIDCSSCKDHSKFVPYLHIKYCSITGEQLKESLKQDMVDLFVKHPHQFGSFCRHLLEGEDCFWHDQIIPPEITAEVYQIMREKFPGRKDG